MCIESLSISYRNLILPFPTLPFQEKLHAILQASELYSSSSELVGRLWEACSDAMYSLTPRQRQLGLGQEVGIGGGAGGGARDGLGILLNHFLSRF